MSTLKVANIHFEATGTNRVEYVANNINFRTGGGNFTISVGGAETLNVNSSGIYDAKGEIRTPRLNDKSSSYTLTANDTGQLISISTGNVFVTDSIFTAGQGVKIYNNSASAITITQNSAVTLYLGGTATTGNRTLAQRGLSDLLCVSANTFVTSGDGLT